MKKLKCNIKVGKFSFQYVIDLVIKTDIKKLTQTCEILLPRKLEWEQKRIALGNNSLLKTGNKVSVALSYDTAPMTVFEGYLSRIKPGVRIGLICEDDMYLLKKNNLTKSYKSVDLKTLLKDTIPPGVIYKAANVQLGQLRLTNVSTAQILQYLRKEYGLFSYFKKNKLLVGLAYWPDEADEHIYHFQRNIKEDGHPEYVKASDVKLKVKAISMMPNNTKYTASLGDNDGEQRTLHFYNIPKSDLEELAKKEIEKLKYDGFRGKFMAFGEPLARVADIADLRNDRVPDQNGKYMIKSNEIKFGTTGFLQTIELGNKI
jgi:hypothetical protein